MSNGWLIAATADAAVGAELAVGFGLELMHPGPPEEREAALAPLVAASNVGVLLTPDAVRDDGFVALLRMLSGRRAGAQLIISSQQTRAAFPFLPDTWPILSLDEALRRARLAAERRAGPLPPTTQQQPQTQDQEGAPEPKPEPQAQSEPEAPLEPEPTHAEASAPIEPEPDHIEAASDERLAPVTEAADDASERESFGAPPPDETETHDLRGEQIEEAKRVTEAEQQAPAEVRDEQDSGARDEPAADAPPASVSAPPQPIQTSPTPEPPSAPPVETARKRSAPPGADDIQRNENMGGLGRVTAERRPDAAPADATAFAPKKLRRAESELVRIAIHQPKDLQRVIRAAKKADPRTDSAPQSMGIGEVAMGAKVGVSLEVRGAACDGALQRRTWVGEPLDFSFAVEADADAKQVVILARVFVDDAQIGVLAFTRGVTGPRPKALSDGERVRLKRHKRVFLSYSSKDRETVAAIATAYEAAGIAHFWDRTSLKSGEEWHPRLRREIDRCDLFHLCWSQSAAASEWVEKEATHALGLRRRKKKPDITVQMLDGPPWAKHPDALDSINFDDFVRAAIVGYARGDGAN